MIDTDYPEKGESLKRVTLPRGPEYFTRPKPGDYVVVWQMQAPALDWHNAGWSSNIDAAIEKARGWWHPEYVIAVRIYTLEAWNYGHMTGESVRKWERREDGEWKEVE
jgi:hypothetical protein